MNLQSILGRCNSFSDPSKAVQDVNRLLKSFSFFSVEPQSIRRQDGSVVSGVLLKGNFSIRYNQQQLLIPMVICPDYYPEKCPTVTIRAPQGYHIVATQTINDRGVIRTPYMMAWNRSCNLYSLASNLFNEVQRSVPFQIGPPISQLPSQTGTIMPQQGPTFGQAMQNMPYNRQTQNYTASGMPIAPLKNIQGENYEEKVTNKIVGELSRLHNDYQTAVGDINAKKRLLNEKMNAFEKTSMELHQKIENVKTIQAQLSQNENQDNSVALPTKNLISEQTLNLEADQLACIDLCYELLELTKKNRIGYDDFTRNCRLIFEKQFEDLYLLNKIQQIRKSM
eukprot:TRINITY_DN13865_c0_g1_i1.p1 TRINITY_DN13865_c0_g1~~TRINITY_DN13865_c0_g1_i1.p1  ORF type:complete len:348 (+),score=97.68 TRINITY_DN13865_c0_g1_i1:32-1045(+)